MQFLVAVFQKSLREIESVELPGHRPADSRARTIGSYKRVADSKTAARKMRFTALAIELVAFFVEVEPNARVFVCLIDQRDVKARTRNRINVFAFATAVRQ